MKRMWINQPSKLQPMHHHHGENVLVCDGSYEHTRQAYFLSGNVVSQEVRKEILSDGWVTKSQNP